MSEDCIFCKILRGEIPSTTVFQNDEMIAIRDINPVAPTHILLIPRQHFVSAANLDDQTALVVGRMMQVAAQLARDESIESTGYRLLTNAGPDSGQIVGHFHLHLIGGRKLKGIG